MGREKILYGLGAFILTFALGFAAGSFTADGSSGSQAFIKDVSFTANASNPVQEVSFDGRNMRIIVQRRKNASFFTDVNGTVEPLDLVHDGEIHEFKKFVTLEGKMYLLSFRYTDDPEKTGDEWLKLYHIREV